MLYAYYMTHFKNPNRLFSIHAIFLKNTYYQRWSRGHKARGQGQGHKKNPRPRPRTGMLEAKAKEQGHRRKRSPKKKGFQKFFSGDLQFIGVPRIFDWRRPKQQIT